MADDQQHFERFKANGDPDYVASSRLASAVNTALAAEQPLVVTGEPGTGKTTLAASIAKQLGYGEVLRFATRSEHQGRDCLYTFDALGRLYDAQAQKDKANDPKQYVRLEALGAAIASEDTHPRVVLIDEIDKASRDFPNDLLDNLDEMRFTVRETGKEYKAKHRPVVLVTSNSERQLPDAFLRRCVFHHIDFPEKAELAKIIRAHLDKLGKTDPGWKTRAAALEKAFVDAVLARFEGVRKEALGKPPATGELLVWVRVLLRAGIKAGQVEKNPLGDLYPGALLKLKGDVDKLVRPQGAA